MQYAAILALAGAAVVSAGGVDSQITPTGEAPAGCSSTYDGSFEITVVKVDTPAKRDLTKRADCPGEGTLVMTLEDGVLKDAKDRTGYIASNFQFQFDGPPQAGAIYTAGFSVCGNSSLALGPTTVFYQCQSGSFYNLYNKNWAPQCKPVAIDAVPCGASSGGASGSAPVPAGSSGSAPAQTQSSDGQPGGASAAPATQIGDGQPQAGSATPVPVSQYTDGQPQVIPTPVSQIGDGQPQAGNATTVNTPTISPAVGAAPYVSLPGAAALAAAGLAVVALL